MRRINAKRFTPTPTTNKLSKVKGKEERNDYTGSSIKKIHTNFSSGTIGRQWDDNHKCLKNGGKFAKKECISPGHW
jgi:hypothetical protein